MTTLLSKVKLWIEQRLIQLERQIVCHPNQGKLNSGVLQNVPFVEGSKLSLGALY